MIVYVPYTITLSTQHLNNMPTLQNITELFNRIIIIIIISYFDITLLPSGKFLAPTPFNSPSNTAILFVLYTQVSLNSIAVAYLILNNSFWGTIRGTL